MFGGLHKRSAKAAEATLYSVATALLRLTHRTTNSEGCGVRVVL
jgi:hypothetical protein